MGLITIILFVLLTMVKSGSQTCKLIGETGFLEFSKDGDLVIGGVFSMSKRRILEDYGYTALPHSYCTQ